LSAYSIVSNPSQLQPMPPELKREPNNQRHLRPDNRHKKCTNSPSSEALAANRKPSPRKKYSKPTKSIYERSTELMEEHHRQVFIEHVKHMIAEDS